MHSRFIQECGIRLDVNQFLSYENCITVGSTTSVHNYVNIRGLEHIANWLGDGFKAVVPTSIPTLLHVNSSTQVTFTSMDNVGVLTRDGWAEGLGIMFISLGIGTNGNTQYTAIVIKDDMELLYDYQFMYSSGVPTNRDFFKVHPRRDMLALTSGKSDTTNKYETIFIFCKTDTGKEVLLITSASSINRTLIDCETGNVICTESRKINPIVYLNRKISTIPIMFDVEDMFQINDAYLGVIIPKLDPDMYIYNGRIYNTFGCYSAGSNDVVFIDVTDVDD